MIATFKGPNSQAATGDVSFDRPVLGTLAFADVERTIYPSYEQDQGNQHLQRPSHFANLVRQTLLPNRVCDLVMKAVPNVDRGSDPKTPAPG